MAPARAAIVASALTFAVTAHAAPAYVCKMLPLSPGQLRDTSMLPPVLSTPGGAVIGRAAGIVYAVAPEHVVRGYQEVMGYGGRRGWVEAARLAPYRSMSDPRATCPAPPWSTTP